MGKLSRFYEWKIGGLKRWRTPFMFEDLMIPYDAEQRDYILSLAKAGTAKVSFALTDI
jgi:hypothetical protein